MGILDADGAFAEYVALPVANLHAVPDGVPDDAAVFTEPLAAAFEILEQVRVEPGAACVVLGDGKLGLLAAQVLAQAGARVLAVGKHDDKLAILRAARHRDGAARALGPRPRRPRRRGHRQRAGFALAVAATRPRGTLVLKSTVAERAPLDLAPLVIDEITVVGSRCGPFAPALAALGRTAASTWRSLIGARYRPARRRRGAAAPRRGPGR